MVAAHTSLRRYGVTGAALLGLSVVFGAFGAHALRGQLSPESLRVYETAVQYQALHAMGTLIAVLLAASGLANDKLTLRAARLFTIGIVFFSGSLYTLVLTGWRTLGAVTPVGGTLFIIGWCVLALAIARSQQ